MKYVILNTKIVKNIDISNMPMNHMTLKITDKVAENDCVVFASNNDTKVHDFFTLLKLAGKGLPNTTLTIA